jgi:integrase
MVPGGAGAANRVLALLSKMMNLAEKWGLRPDGSNPRRHVEKFEETKRERYLTGDELARLGDVLTETEQASTELPSVIAAVRLLVLTGCRLSEILTLQWQFVDLQAACLRLPESKTGAKIVHLNAPALEVLAGIEPQNENRWVIVGAKAGSHLINLEKPWRRIRARARLDDVRLHDLRHSFASVAVGLGEGLPMFGKLFGHTQTQTTARYAHLASDPVKAATERVGAALAGMMTGKRGAVVPLLKAS